MILNHPKTFLYLYSFIWLITWFIAPNLYFGETFFPQIPVLGNFEISQTVKFIITLIVFIALAAVVLFKESNWIAYILLFSFFIWMLTDSLRLQAYFYQILCFLLLFTFSKSNFKQNHPLLLMSVYCFSGISKLNAYYFESIIPQLNQAYTWLPNVLSNALFLLAPFIEIFIALCLLKNYRKLGIMLVIFSHLFMILVIVSQQNWVVLPWNIALACMTCITLLANEGISIQSVRKNYWVGIISLLIPILSFTTFIPSYLGFQVYSGTNGKAQIYFGEAAWNKFPGSVKKSYQKGYQTQIISLNEWCFYENNCHIPLSIGYLKKISERMAIYGQPSEEIFVFYDKPRIFNSESIEIK